MEQPQLPDGYRWTGRQFEIQLIDPVDCPAGHPVYKGIRGGPQQCREHGDHFRWRCGCGQQIWRYDGTFHGALPCLTAGR
jgi:hypothetical protein